MAGLGPAIHAFRAVSTARRGWSAAGLRGACFADRDGERTLPRSNQAIKADRVLTEAWTPGLRMPGGRSGFVAMHADDSIL
jgi:hypothetical protein